MGSVCRDCGVMNRRLFTLSVAARLPHGMFSIAVLVHASHVTDSFAIAGVCTAILAISQAVGGPLAGRLVDRHGQTLPLLVSAVGCSLGLVALAALDGDAPTGWFLGGSALSGLCAPPVGACLRALVPDLVPTAAAQRRVYAMDAAATEITWVAGPVITFALAGWAGTSSALVGAATLLALSVAGFTACRASRRWRPVPADTGRRGALGSVNLRVLIAVLIGVGILFGATEIGVTALTEALGAPQAAGPLLGLWGLGSLCGGVVVARYGGGAKTGRGLAVLLAVLAIGHAALATATSHWVFLGVLIAAAGSMIAPILATAYGMIDQIVPTGTRTEAFAWLATATAVGTAIGAALAGALVETSGPAAGFLLAGLAAAFAAGLAGRGLRVTTNPATPASARDAQTVSCISATRFPPHCSVPSIRSQLATVTPSATTTPSPSVSR